MKRLLPFAFAALTIPSLAFAGPQFVDETGFAASGYDVVAYFDLKQNKIGQSQPKGIPGKSSITAEYNGATWAFSTKANRDLFLKNPEAYAPQYDGHCAYGVAQGGKVPGNPNLWRIRDGKLYLNITKNVVGFWEKDIAGNLKKSTKNWVKLEPKGASNATIPNFSSKAPQS
ncbi:YHS domain-containing (seleno)protein [Aliiroseovarius sp. 2305UL8-7]|uniref:YHS domain-containing (seleno)protein n=1 Tax=Aliiroseovarius conchicola TaxID=3121637 RepID=UPI0035272E83